MTVKYNVVFMTKFCGCFCVGFIVYPFKRQPHKIVKHTEIGILKPY